MRRPFLVGRQVYLRALEESDIGEDYVRWLNDPEVTRYLASGKFPVTPEAIRRHLARFQDPATDVIFAIVEKASHQHVGNVTINHIDWVNRTADTGLMIGRKECWGRGYAFDAWGLVLAYAFDRLGLRKIIAGAISGHTASLSVLKRLGFRVEGTLREEYLVDGEYRDAIRLGLFRGELCRDAVRASDHTGVEAHGFP